MNAGDRIGFMVKGANGQERVTGRIVSMETWPNGHLQHGWVLVDGYEQYVGITPDTVIDPPAPKEDDNGNR